MHCEIDPAAVAVLREQFHRKEVVQDVREVDALPNNIDILCAGFPCQDLSSVGQKEGVKGSKSSLIDEVFRILRKTPAEWVIIENVFFMLHLKRGTAMATIASSLEELGYRWAYRVIDSIAFGLPHRRKRVYLVASLSHDPRDVLLSGDCPPLQEEVPSLAVPLGFYWTEGTYAVGLAVNAIPPLKAGSTIGIPSPPAILFPDGRVTTPDIRDAERFQGFEADWTAPAEGATKRSVRWRLVGNAVTVEVARWIGNKLYSPVSYDGTADQPLLPNNRWPRAAWNLGEGRFISKVSDYPVKYPSRGIDHFLEFPPRLLSAKATGGFLQRAMIGNLWFPPGFLEALKNHHASMTHS